MSRPSGTPAELYQIQAAEIKARTINWKLRNAKMRGELINKAELLQALEIVAVSIKEIVEASKLLDREKEALLLNIARVPEIVMGVAEQQGHADDESPPAPPKQKVRRRSRKASPE